MTTDDRTRPVAPRAESLTEVSPARAPLHGEHAALGAHFTNFGGWDMPLKYESELAEHRSVREAAGLFDLSHMGEIRVEGPDAGTYLNSVLAGNLAAVRVGRAKYSLLLQEDGGIIDDLISYRLADDRYLVVPNAGNTIMVLQEFQRRAAELRQEGIDVTVTDESRATSLLAVQGPKAADILASLASTDEAGDHSAAGTIRELRYYSASHVALNRAPVLLARTGYTGEDGFELYVANEHAVELWRAILAAGVPHELTPAGLASRDSLRLEAGMPLYGNELTRATTPIEAGLGGIVSLTKPECFEGREALETAGDPARVLVGLKGLGRRAGRAGYDVLANGKTIGRVTSGQPSPTLGYPIALAYVDVAFREPGTRLEIDVRGTPQPAEVVDLPFYRRTT